MTTQTIPTIRKMSPQLVVADIDRATDFYINKLGFHLDFLYEDFYAGIMKDGHSIHLKSGTPSAQERNSKRKNVDLDIVFSVGDIESLYNELQDKAVEIIQPLGDQPYGKEFYIVDPDGYLIAFLEEA